MASRSPSTDRAPLTEAQARRRVKREKEFYVGLATYAATISGLAALNVLTSPGTLWFVWPMLGWGAGVLSHAVGVFGVPGLGGWEDRRMRALVGGDTSEARLREILDETLGERAVPAGRPQSTDQLQRRIEHLEAIVTSRDWDQVDPERPAPGARAAGGGRLDLGDMEDDVAGSGADHAAEAARLARRVR